MANTSTNHCTARLKLRFRQGGLIALLAIVWTVAYAADARLVYYDVVGDSATKLRHELDHKGPLVNGERFDAYTTWTVSWTFSFVPTAAGCRLTEVNASIAGRIDLPRWEHGDNASARLVKEWERYLTGLRVHEDGHYAHGRAGQDEIQALGQSFQITDSCASMAKAFNDQANAILTKYRAMDAAYDLETDHGRKQGAVFP